MKLKYLEYSHCKMYWLNLWFVDNAEANSAEGYNWRAGFINAINRERAATRKVIEYVHKMEHSSVNLTEAEKKDYKRALAIASNKALKDYLKKVNQELIDNVSSLDILSVDEPVSISSKDTIFKVKLAKKSCELF